MDCQKKMNISDNLRCTKSNDSTEDSAIFKLNEDCMRHIFSYLSVKERVRIERVCKKWQYLSKLPWSDKKQLFLRCKENDRFDAMGVEKMTLPVLKRILNICGSSMKSITIEFVRDASLHILSLIHKCCPNVLTLEFFDINLTQMEAGYFAYNFDKLTEVSIEYCTSSFEDSLRRFFQLNPQLRSVELIDIDSLIGECLHDLPDTIEKISIMQCEQLTVENLLKSLQRFNHLQSMSIDGNLLLHIDKLLHVIPNKYNLDALSLSKMFLRSNSLLQPINNLHHFTNIRKLSLSGNTILCDEILNIFGKYCVHVIDVSLAFSSRITDFGWQNLVKSLNLEKLWAFNLTGISDKFLTFLRKSSLKDVTFHQIPVTNESLRSLMQDAKNLETLIVRRCAEVDTNIFQKDVVIFNVQRPSYKKLKV